MSPAARRDRPAIGILALLAPEAVPDADWLDVAIATRPLDSGSTSASGAPPR
jgi:hypothetical protein